MAKICTKTEKPCENLEVRTDQFGWAFGRCKKADCHIWNVKSCDGRNPQKADKTQ